MNSYGVLNVMWILRVIRDDIDRVRDSVRDAPYDDTIRSLEEVKDYITKVQRIITDEDE